MPSISARNLRISQFAGKGGAGKAIRAEWRGVKQLRKEIDLLIGHMEGTEKSSALMAMEDVMRAPVELMRDIMKDRETSSRWPSEVIAATFADPDLSKQTGKKRAAVAGVQTGSPRGRYPDVRSRSNPRGVYVEWGKRSGKIVGMSLARIFESGTRKFPGRPAIAQAIQQAGPQALTLLGDGYRSLLRDFQGQPSVDAE